MSSIIGTILGIILSPILIPLYVLDGWEKSNRSHSDWLEHLDTIIKKERIDELDRLNGHSIPDEESINKNIIANTTSVKFEDGWNKDIVFLYATDSFEYYLKYTTIIYLRYNKVKRVWSNFNPEKLPAICSTRPKPLKKTLPPNTDISILESTKNQV